MWAPKSRHSHRSGRRAGVLEVGPSHGRGCALFSFTLRANERADELTVRSGTPRRCVCCAPARSSPDHPPRPKPGRQWRTANDQQPGQGPDVIESARPPRQSLRLVSRRSQSRRLSQMLRAPPRIRCAREPVTSSDRAPGPDFFSLQPSSPVQPTALPPAAPPSFMRGTCGGIFDAVGRETGSSLRLRATPPNPHPFP